MKQEPDCQLPTVGFFPRFHGLGETYPLIEIAKRYKQLGGEVVFFSHGGEYEHLVEELGCEIIRINPVTRKTSKYLLQHSDEDLIKIIEDEAFVYGNAGISALIQTNVFFGCLLASRVAKIPLISVVSGTWIPPYFKGNYATYPDRSENFFTRLIPHFLKNRVANWCALKYKGPITRKINRIAKKINIDLHFKCKSELLLGDYTLICDDIKFLGAKPTKDFSLENYVGPILPNDWLIQEEKQLESDIEKHLKKPGKHILLTMGTSPQWKEFFLKILKILNQTEYNVIATYTTILGEDEIPKLNDNILLKKFIPNMAMLNQKTDINIIHGGRGTVYSVAYSGKPAIGFALHVEQQCNLDNLVRHGTSLRLSKTFFKEENLLSAIGDIFDNYDAYLNNSRVLKENLPRLEGDTNTALKIVEILRHN